MKEMLRHVPDAGSYARVTVLIDQRPAARAFLLRRDGRLSGSVRQCGGPESRAELDSNIESLVREAASVCSVAFDRIRPDHSFQLLPVPSFREGGDCASRWTSSEVLRTF